MNSLRLAYYTNPKVQSHVLQVIILFVKIGHSPKLIKQIPNNGHTVITFSKQPYSNYLLKTSIITGANRALRPLSLYSHTLFFHLDGFPIVLRPLEDSALSLSLDVSSITY